MVGRLCPKDGSEVLDLKSFDQPLVLVSLPASSSIVTPFRLHRPSFESTFLSWASNRSSLYVMHRALLALLRETHLRRTLLPAKQAQPCLVQQCAAHFRLQPEPGVCLASRSYSSESGADSGSPDGPGSSAPEASMPSEEGQDKDIPNADGSDALEAAGSQDEDSLSGSLDSLSSGDLKPGSKNPARGPGGLDWHLGEPFHHFERSPS